ncbi:MAG: radical SAM protein [Planctomycetota bacterium]|nr:radical SAM protein [Planctomycetota bacterium]
MADRTQYVYGPVPSRRLGRSLGVDLIPFKTCSYDCIYCQLGPTTNRTVERREYVPTGTVLTQVQDRLAGLAAPPDYITLAGSGEPTLHSGLGRLASEIKRCTDVPVAVLTNGSLLFEPAVADALAEADLVVPSLDAGTAGVWRQVNRPHPDLVWERMIGGLETFTARFGGQVWLEVMLLSGVTGPEAEVRKIAALAKDIGPDRVQLNTAVRPAAESFALPLSRERLEELARLFDPPAEVVADFREPAAQEGAATPDDVLDLLFRRPCSAKDVADGLGIRPNEALKLIDELTGAGRAEAVRRDTGVFYKALEA